MKVAEITKAQAISLKGKTYDGTQYFAPVKDINENWCLSQQEIENCTNEDFTWVKELIADKEYNPKKITI